MPRTRDSNSVGATVRKAGRDRITVFTQGRKAADRPCRDQAQGNSHPVSG
ncbi:hypothetical protein LWC05_14930 [Acetobacter sicerae]|uniref:Uncharacterized protein n=1 Tax=Acetobacter sicerae TaxID=85325 RepID=A0ABS8W035_9PROT|nr:hypothetical protein [Acetobacter sicerae]MCE0745168.1 hypothetical protein [Acetobacter sicerae]